MKIGSPYSGLLQCAGRQVRSRQLCEAFQRHCTYWGNDSKHRTVFLFVFFFFFAQLKVYSSCQSCTGEQFVGLVRSLFAGQKETDGMAFVYKSLFRPAEIRVLWGDDADDKEDEGYGELGRLPSRYLNR